MRRSRLPQLKPHRPQTSCPSPRGLIDTVWEVPPPFTSFLPSKISPLIFPGSRSQRSIQSLISQSLDSFETKILKYSFLKARRALKPISKQAETSYFHLPPGLHQSDSICAQVRHFLQSSFFFWQLEDAWSVPNSSHPYPSITYWAFSERHKMGNHICSGNKLKIAHFCDNFAWPICAVLHSLVVEVDLEMVWVGRNFAPDFFTNFHHPEKSAWVKVMRAIPVTRVSNGCAKV